MLDYHVSKMISAIYASINPNYNHGLPCQIYQGYRDFGRQIVGDVNTKVAARCSHDMSSSPVPRMTNSGQRSSSLQPQQRHLNRRLECLGGAGV